MGTFKPAGTRHKCGRQIADAPRAKSTQKPTANRPTHSTELPQALVVAGKGPFVPWVTRAAKCAIRADLAAPGRDRSATAKASPGASGTQFLIDYVRKRPKYCLVDVGFPVLVPDVQRQRR